ncbi:rod-binding protein [Neorhodopirellula pilleata]|uniref:Rod binding protein n=1 Tax=Neorhodopirellula pilleata TaxID=2714738 RepID=A0A5C5ZWD2_9BACT|nr:rod-binding protein [Neorhodopirellula pilleata]TWT91922.1 Rod binding protein [Neorhodopirellula pilleata]
MIQSLNQQSIPAAAAQPKLPYELSAKFGSAGSPTSSGTPSTDSEPMREAFGDFVGQTLFGSMLSSMRKSLDKPAYFHGGRAEEVFQEQLDQKLVEEISDASADSFVNPMFDLFQLQRRG